MAQRRLRLGQPEGHLHGMVEADGGGQFGAGLAGASTPGVQLSQAKVAMGLEPAVWH
jgi:hypothetical protein